MTNTGFINHRIEEIRAIEGMRFFKTKPRKKQNFVEQVLTEIWNEIIKERVTKLPKTTFARGTRGRVQLNSLAARGLETGDGDYSKGANGSKYPIYMQIADERRMEDESEEAYGDCFT